MGKPVRARVRVQVTVAFDLTDRWGPDASVGQVQKQAVDGAEQVLQETLKTLPGGRLLKVEPEIVLLSAEDP